MAGKGGKTPGAGRPKGSVNKTTAAAKESIEQAFAAMGGQATFVNWCKTHKDDFYRLLWPRLLPRDINADVNLSGGAKFIISDRPMTEEEWEEQRASDE